MGSTRLRSLFVATALLALPPAVGGAEEAPHSLTRPADVGMAEGVLLSGITLFEEALEKDDLKGAVLLVARRGRVVLHEAVGWRNEEEQLPMERGTLFRLASNTKPVVATAVLMLAEADRLALTDNVRSHLDGWDNYKSGFVRIEHLLSHTSGLRISSLFVEPLLERSPEHPNAPDIVSEATRFGEIGPTYPPGTTYTYNNPGFNTLGAVITVASERSLKEYLREAIYQPLGMVDSYNHEPDAPQHRMSRVYRRRDGKWSIDWSPGDPPEVPFARASGGMISTAADYFRFLQMYLNGGILEGTRLLSEESVAAATRSHTEGIRNTAERGSPAAYGYGWQVDSDGSFSHGGSDGTWAWVDPAREIVGLVFTQSPGGRIPREQFRRVVEAACASEE